MVAGPVDPMERDDCLQALRMAFGDVVLGAGISIAEARALDDRDYSLADCVRKEHSQSRAQPWQSVPPADVLRFLDAIPFLDELGFRYYVPIFLTAALNGSDVPIVEALQGESHGSLLDSSTSRNSLLHGLNVQQLLAVRMSAALICRMDGDVPPSELFDAIDRIVGSKTWTAGSE